MQYFTCAVEPLRGGRSPVGLPKLPGLAELFRVPWARLADIADEKELYDRLAPNRLKAKRPSATARTRVRDQRIIHGRFTKAPPRVYRFPAGSSHTSSESREPSLKPCGNRTKWRLIACRRTWVLSFDGSRHRRTQRGSRR